jgi:hypothetical protein
MEESLDASVWARRQDVVSLNEESTEVLYPVTELLGHSHVALNIDK